MLWNNGPIEKVTHKKDYIWDLFVWLKNIMVP